MPAGSSFSFSPSAQSPERALLPPMVPPVPPEDHGGGGEEAVLPEDHQGGGEGEGGGGEAADEDPADEDPAVVPGHDVAHIRQPENAFEVSDFHSILLPKLVPVLPALKPVPLYFVLPIWRVSHSASVLKASTRKLVEDAVPEK
jgi:hypothetical protein